jgi:2,3-bisphosphoglycerate-independent phosphoglycerate mutase
VIRIDQIRELAIETRSKIILIVIDGLGGLQDLHTGLTELESAKKPNIDALMAKSTCGLVQPLGIGITSGSGPAQLALLGYDPMQYEVGRGVLEALGLDMDLGPDDVAVRGNLCTVNEEGTVVDRRAGRLETSKTIRLCEILQGIQLNGTTARLRAGKMYGFAAVFSGDDLRGELSDSDPQKEGLPPKRVLPLVPEAEKTALVLNEFILNARDVLKDSYPANMLLLRGFGRLPHIPSMHELFKLTPAAIATYPMYRGLGALLGMDILPTGESISDQFDILNRHYHDYDFFYLLIKDMDIYGESRNFSQRVVVIEELDAILPRLMALNPDVVIITGDHSTPARLGGHSWHPVPMLLYSEWCRPDNVSTFGERTCRYGGLGLLSSLAVMPLALANALKLRKYGA